MARTYTTNETVDTMLDISAPILDLLETSLELVPIPGLGLIPKALSAVVDQIKGARANEEAYSSFKAQVELLSSVIEAMISTAKNIANTAGIDAKGRKKVFDEIAQSADMQRAVEELKSTIQGLVRDAGRLHHGKGLTAFVKSVVYKSRDEGVISGMKNKLGAAIQAFQIRSHIVIDKGVQEIQQMLREIDDAAKINLIPRVPAGFDAPGVAQLKEEFLEGTRTALFDDEIEPWLTGSYPEGATKPVFFLSGGAGLGKSSITHRLCTRLHDPQRPGRRGASYFFIRSDSTLSSHFLFFSTLLHQLALACPFLRPSIVAAVRQYLERGDPQNMEAVSEDILRSSLLNAPDADRETLFLVFDGLDECSDRRILPQLVLALLALVRDVPWLRIFMASRPEPHVMAVLTSSDANKLVHHRALEETPDDSKKDVGLYLRDSLSKMPEYTALPSAGFQNLERLIERAGTSFIFARIALNFLEMHCDNPEEPLKILAQSGGGGGLKELDTLYLQVLRLAYPPDSLHDVPTVHGRLLALLIIIVLEGEACGPSVACRPALVANLGTKLLQTYVLKNRIPRLSSDSTAVLVFSEDDVGRTVDRLRSILLLRDNGVITPIHATFFEFLVNEQRCNDSLYHVNKLEGHAGLMAAWHDSGAISLETTTMLLGRDLPRTRFSGFLNSISFAPPAWLYHCFRGAQFYPHDCWMDILRALSTGIQIPILMRYYNLTQNFVKKPPSPGVIVPWIVTRSYVDATMLNAVELEFLKFALYSQLWWSTVIDRQYMDREIKREDIAKLINYHCRAGIKVLPEDMARYRAAHEQLADMIDRDAQVRSVWYKRGDHRYWKSPTHLWKALRLSVDVELNEGVASDQDNSAT